MDKIVNPWSGKVKQKGEGTLNSILAKHFPINEDKEISYFQEE